MRKPTRWQRDELVDAVREAKEQAETYAPGDWTLNQLLGAAIRLAHTTELRDEDE